MIKKIIHIADIHIRTLQLHDLYKQQFTRFINEITTKKKQWDLTTDEIRIVIAGDIAHQKINISNEQLMLTSWFLNELSKIGVVIIIPGNHDFLENNVQRLDSITPVIELLNNRNIKYFRDSGVYEDSNIDWVVYSLYQHNQRPDFVVNNRFKIGLFHGPIQGMSTDLGFQFDDAYDRLNFIGLNLLLCGDIHKRQTFTLPNNGQGIMVGSFIQQGFGETVNHHGYGIFDMETKTYDFYDLPNEQPFYHIKITDITDIENEKETILNIG